MNFIQICIDHYLLINNQFDLIKNVDFEWLIDTKRVNHIMNQIHYLIALCALNYFTLDTILIGYQHCILEHDCTKLINSTRLFSHRIFPRLFWYQGDIYAIICFGMAISNFTILLFNNCLNCLYC